MLLVVNPNPAVDRIAVVDFRPGSTLRPSRSFEWPGGSGVHAAHVARQFGVEVEVVAFVGGLYGARFLELASQHDIRVTALENSSPTRSTFSLIDHNRGNICDVAELAGPVPAGADRELLAAVERRLPEADAVIVSGSVPRGLAATIYRDVTQLARGNGVPVFADLTSDPLVAVLEASPWMVKPSLEELQRDGLTSGTARDLLRLAKRWSDAGVAHVCISLAGAGVLWVSAEGARRVGISHGPVYNTIGAGDTLVGATAAAITLGADMESALRRGVAAATVNLSRDEPGHCTSEEVAALEPTTFVEDVDEPALAAILDS